MIGKGFPTRPVRDDFGPEPVNRRPVRDPAQELDGETVGRLMFWQLAGLGLTGARAWLDLNCTDPVAPEVLEWAAAWDPRQEAAAPSITRTGPGVYRVQFAANYDNEQAESVALDVQRPRAWVPGAPGTLIMVNPIKIDARTVDLEIYTWNAGGPAWDLTDGQEVFLEVF